jgi:cell division protein FtsI (penicillin-binding protein 3)
MRKSRGRPRLAFAVLIVLIVGVAFIVRLVDIQVVSASALTAEAADKRGLTAPVYGTRGAIIDAQGAVLADSVERYELSVSPRVVLGTSGVNAGLVPALESIAAITGQDAAVLLTSIQADPESDYLVLATDLTLAQFEALRELDISWDYYDRIAARSYPNGAIAGNLVGFLGTDQPLAGLESSEDACLASENGTVSYERSEDGVRIPDTEIETDPAKDGGTLQLTIDRDLQWYVQERMAKTAGEFGATWASAVVIRVSDGAIMALSDWPTVDPNDFGSADPGATGARSFAIPYEPGSIMKPINAVMALDYGSMTPTTPLTSPDSMDFGDAGVISDVVWHQPQITVTGSLVYSSNTGTAQIANSVPDDVRRDYMEAFGFGDYTEVDFTGESTGDLGEYWDARTRLTVGFGQGMTSTIVQMGSAFQTIANDGLRMPVKLVESCTTADGTVEPPRVTGEPVQVVSASAAQQTVSMMESVAQHGGVWDALQIPGYRIAAKSGTAEVAEGGVYTDQVVVSYAGIAPADDPQYVVVVSAGLGYSGFSSDIAPTLHDIMAQTLTTFRVGPSVGSAAELPIEW